MPLHGKDPFELNKTRVKSGEEYFVIKFTKEHFKRYKDYIDRYELYRQKIWTCSITGKQNLTFEEALLSEKNASEKVSKVSELLLPHCLEFIQYKEITLEEMTNQLYEFLLMNYYPGEIVSFKKDNTKYTGRIIELLENYSESDGQSDNEQKKPSSSTNSTAPTTPTLASSSSTSINALSSIPIPKKEIKSQLYSDDEEEEGDEEKQESSSKKNGVNDKKAEKEKDGSDKKGEKDGETKAIRKYVDPRKKLDSIKKYYKIYVDSQTKNFIVNIKDIQKREPPIFKPMVKDTIKTVAKKTKHLGGFWEVEPELIKKYNLGGLKIPSSIKKEVGQHLKRKRLAEGETIEDLEEESVDIENSNNSNKNNDNSNNNLDSSDESETERKRKRSKYPIEDQDIERDEETDKENERPIASSDFFCLSSTFGDFLMVWHFLNHFEKVLLLSPFPLDDFEMAVQHHTETNILVESHIRLMKTIFTLPSYSSGTPKKTFGGRAITDRNWLATLRAYFQNEVKRIAIEEKQKQEKLKQLEEQNIRMLNLANELPGSDDEENTDEMKLDEGGNEIKQDNQMKDSGEENGTKESDDATKAEGEEGESEEEMEEDDEEAGSDDSEEEWKEENETITSADANVICKVLKKKNYFKLSVDERIYILAYLVKQTIASEKIRKHLEKNVELGNEIKQEKKGIIQEEKQLKQEDSTTADDDDENNNNDEDEEQEVKKGKGGNKQKKTLAPQIEKEIDKLEKKLEGLDEKLEKYSTRLESLGRDRHYRNYWYWYQLPSKIYVENENGGWEYYSSKKELDDLMKYLDNRGIRERKLLFNIKPKYDFISSQLEKKNKEIIEQIQYESKRSQRIKQLYTEKSYISWENNYEY
ncbi:hypothetical protein RB653_006294 [Dictyostelium firmibasis]|uniref:DDT domain-containing protein n=1 Tax=Dictyostelium firmibasis TaxID=79012 RepID=A0AAN7U8P7_9MYCE